MKLQVKGGVHWCLSLVLFIAVCKVQGETLVVGYNKKVDINLTIPTNQALVVYGGNFRSAYPPSYWVLTQYGQMYLFAVSDGTNADPILSARQGHPNIFAGPINLELFIPAVLDEGSWISYEVLPLEGLKTMFVPVGETNTATVTPSTTLQAVSASPDLWQDASNSSIWLTSGSDQAKVSFSSDTSSIFDMNFFGPVELELRASGTSVNWLTYSLHSGEVALLPEGVIEAYGGNALVIEESDDLMDWSTAAMMHKDASQKFYRIKVSR